MGNYISSFDYIKASNFKIALSDFLELHNLEELLISEDIKDTIRGLDLNTNSFEISEQEILQYQKIAEDRQFFDYLKPCLLPFIKKDLYT